MNVKISYDFAGELWKYPGNGGWYFISLPEEYTKEIRDNLQWQEEGWGRMKATASIKNIEWDTAIWFDRKRNTYLLPIKSDIRRQAMLDINKTYRVIISL